jgi:uncharacterized protein YoxC
MQLWEIIVLLVGIAFVVLTVYLLIAVKKLSSALDKLDKLLTDNAPSITSIVSNVDCITTDTKSIVTKVGNAVTKADKLSSFIKHDNAADQIVNIKKALDTAGIIFTGYKTIKNFLDRRKMKKLLKNSANIRK